MARKIKICKEKECDNEQTTSGYCRYHYLRNWRQVKEKQQKQSVKALNQYIDHICSKHPENYVAAVKRDLASPEFFSRRAGDYLYDEDTDFIETLVESGDIKRLISHLKVDNSY